jgi:hypothetical protein
MNWARLDGHVAAVTGGNAGIGLGLARGLARAGASVAILGRREDRNAAAVKQLTEDVPGSDVRAFACDVTNEDAVTVALKKVADGFGRFDSCFVNAGASGAARSMMSVSAAEWRDVLAVNLDGALFSARAAASLMQQQGEGGSIVLTSSLAAFDGTPLHGAYAASKAAVLALVRSLAVGLARDRIRVNAIVPGWVETAMTAGTLANDTAARKILSRVPLHRWGTVDDFEALAVLLAGPGSSYLTGQALVVDGGYSIF